MAGGARVEPDDGTRARVVGGANASVLHAAAGRAKPIPAHVGQLSERRMSHRGTPSSGSWPARPAVYCCLRPAAALPAAALFPELKQLAAPASLGTPRWISAPGSTAPPLSVRKG